MKLDILTLVYIQAIITIIQLIALLAQYRINQTYRGPGLWLLGSTLIAFGVVFMAFVNVPYLLFLARISNLLVVIGQIVLYIGVVRFLGKKACNWILVLILAAFIIFYYFYMFISDDLSARTTALCAALAAISMMTASRLFFNNDKVSSVSVRFTAVIFFVTGIFLMYRLFAAIILPRMNSYNDQAVILALSFIVSIITSTLWTFGFVIMVNQRLNTEIRLEKEKLQQIFNTSPDAAMIMRVEDGLILDVNAGFLTLTGFSRDEVVGNTVTKVRTWHHAADQETFIALLKDKGICEEQEFIFRRKDDSLFDGVISAKNMIINTAPHSCIVIRDVTQRKTAEKQIKELVHQLEIEKNTAELNSITDSLTGLANRRYFDSALKTEFYRLKRSGLYLSLIMLDIDYFKSFNDLYGHIAGDECLRQIGYMLKTIAGRAADIVARYGGEEFVIILPETDSHGTEELAKRIQKGIEALAIPHAKSDISKFITISIGILTLCTTELNAPEEMVELVDRVLYSAKNAGRNKIELLTI